MNKQKFISLIQHPQSLSSSDLKKLEDLQKEYPYFSISYALTARIKHQEKTPDAKSALGKAALYTADRHVLKVLVTSPTGLEEAPVPAPEPQPTAEPIQEEPIIQQPPPTQETAPEPEPPAQREEEPPSVRRIIFEDQPQSAGHHLEESFYEEVEANLKNLTAQKKALSMWIKLGEPTDHDSEDDQESHVVYTEDEVDPSPEDTHQASEETWNFSQEPEPEETQAEEPQSASAHLEEHPESSTATPQNPEATTAEESKTESPAEQPEQYTGSMPPPLPAEAKAPEEAEEPKRPVLPPPLPPQATLSPEREDEIISELNQRETAEPESDWQREQTEMIDRFLEGNLANRRPAEYPEPGDLNSQEDLSLKSQEFGDNIISENLAQILTKQGKLTKAIEIYRKLIWKFPQKKAYFAALIEELKNKE